MGKRKYSAGVVEISLYEYRDLIVGANERDKLKEELKRASEQIKVMQELINDLRVHDVPTYPLDYQPPCYPLSKQREEGK
jgi:hypothetical protein